MCFEASGMAQERAAQAKGGRRESQSLKEPIAWPRQPRGGCRESICTSQGACIGCGLLAEVCMGEHMAKR